MSEKRKVAKVGEVSSSRPLIVRVPGKNVALLRQPDGRIEAFEMICRHQHADLTTGQIEGRHVTCARHGWKFDLSTGDCLTTPWAKLRRNQVEVTGGEVWISEKPVDDEAPPDDMPDLSSWA
jgi:nitrite reductase/ring-hydroxylating ferredoxin subunit